MSLLREAASNAEFQNILNQRIAKGERTLHGVAEVPCAKIRSLHAAENTDQRAIGDRLYYVLDADMPGLAHHADLFATAPKPVDGKTPKAAWKRERVRLLALLKEKIISPDQFRDGALLPRGE